MDGNNENGETIRNIAIKLMESKYKSGNINESGSRVIFILGNKSCGKTTLANIILDKDETCNATLGLDYTFVRKNVHSHLSDKNICHIWELGGDMFKTLDILNVPFLAHKQSYMTIILVLDLSQPKTLWITLENLINNLKSVIEKNNHINSASEINIDQEETSRFPLPLVIVGGKYDIFHEFDSGVKKVVCKMLRSVALLMGASLLFFSKSDQALKKKMKDLLNHVCFGTEQKIKSVIHDFNKPLYISSNVDSWESIGISKISWDIVKSLYVTQFPQMHQTITTVSDPSLEANYREPMIDIVRSQKDEELKLLMANSIRSYF